MIKDDDFSDNNDEPDFSSLNKYFKKDDSTKEAEPVKVKTITEDISITESFESNENNDEIGIPKIHQRIEKKGCPNKIKYLKAIYDDSLNLDTCSSVNRDWNKK